MLESSKEDKNNIVLQWFPHRDHSTAVAVARKWTCHSRNDPLRQQFDPVAPLSRDHLGFSHLVAWDSGIQYHDSVRPQRDSIAWPGYS